MGILIIFALGMFGVWLAINLRKKPGRKASAGSKVSERLQDIRNDPLYHTYSEKTRELLGAIFDQLAAMPKKLHQIYKEENDTHMKHMEEAKASPTSLTYPFPYPKQITLLDELDALVSDTLTKWNALTPPKSCSLLHNGYKLMLRTGFINA